MPKLAPKIMNNEIKKYPIFMLENGVLKRCDFIESTEDYNHYLAELHHFVPYTDWEKNTKNVRNKVSQKLILMPKIVHQHLENPDYRLPNEVFKKYYGINPQELLFDVNRRDFQQQPNLENEDYDGCFDDVDFKTEMEKVQNV